MKKLILTIIFLLTVSIAFAFNPMDVLTEEHDEQLHILMSKSINDFLTTKTELTAFERLVTMELIGMTKETLDVYAGGEWDTDDQDANRIGFIISELINFEWRF